MLTWPTVSEDNRVIVIGTGPPGAAAAVFLANAGVDVLLLEAGAEGDSDGLTLRLGGVTLAKRKRTLQQRPGVKRTGNAEAQLFEELAPGGLSNHWSCAVPRFAPEDFEDARRAGEEQTWPLDYADLAPWYDRVEPLLHISGAPDGSAQLPAPRVRHVRRLGSDWQPLCSRASEQGRTIRAMPYAYGADSTLTRSGTPFNSFVRLIKPLLAQGKVQVRFNAAVCGLDWLPAERRVRAVRFRDRSSGNESSVPCRAVVVGAGALSTPLILLQSRSADFPNGLGNEHGLVGRYLHDHPVGKVVIDLNRPLSVHPASYITRLSLSHAKLPLYAAACMQWSSTTDLAKSLVGLHPGRLSTVGFSVFGTMAPSQSNYVALDPVQRNPDGTPGLELHVHHPPESTTVLEEARDHVVELLAAAGFNPRIRVWKVEAIGNSNHYAGTCRMHASPRYGVLNGWGRLHAVRNVAVADSSAFTTGPEKNPVLTSMTLAARASARLAAELKDGNL